MAAVQAFRRSYYLVARGNNRNNGTSLGAVTLNANNALGNSNGNNWRSRLHIAPRAIYFLLNFCPRRKTAAWTAPEPETPHRAAGRARKRMRGERRPMRGGSAERPRFLSRFVRENEGGEADWCYFFDISKCYQHIMPPVVMSRLLDIFKDRRALGMFEIVLESAWEGLPIGYPFSHALANLVLSPLHAMMQSHKNVSAGFVYMDNHDFFSRYKNTLRNARPQVDRWLEGIGCHAKHDWQIFRPADRGVNICGFTVYPDHVELYRRIWHRIMRNIDAIKTAWQFKDYLSLMSRKGWLMAANKLYTPSLQIEQGEYLWR